MNGHRADAVAIRFGHDVRAALHHPLVARLVIQNVRGRYVGDFSGEWFVGVARIDLAVDDLSIAVVEYIALAAGEQQDDVGGRDKRHSTRFQVQDFDG